MHCCCDDVMMWLNLAPEVVEYYYFFLIHKSPMGFEIKYNKLTFGIIDKLISE